MRRSLYMGARGRRPGSPERLCKIAIDLKTYLDQTDCAVVAHHSGDEEYQAIFPLCSEYNRHSGLYSGGTFYFEGKDGEELDFDSIDDAIEAVLAREIR